MIPVRLLYDFVAVGACIGGDLPEATRREMVGFFRNELKSDGWVSGLSGWDDDAVRSFRPDWAWTGSYGAFPSMSVAGLRGLGCNEDWIVEWLRKVSRATWQGPIGQCHHVEALGVGPRVGVKKATAGGWNVNATAAFPWMIVEHCLGARPTLRDGVRFDGFLSSFDPNAVLENLSHQGATYRVTGMGVEKALHGTG
jgi:hypothetical protein